MNTSKKLPITPRISSFYAHAHKQAEEKGLEWVSDKQLILAMFADNDSQICRTLNDLGINKKSVIDNLNSRPD